VLLDELPAALPLESRITASALPPQGSGATGSELTRWLCHPAPGTQGATKLLMIGMHAVRRLNKGDVIVPVEAFRPGGARGDSVDL